MRYYQIEDLEVSCIGFGCMRLADKSVDEVEELLLCAYENGINFFDHADIYGGGKSEEVFGQALQRHRELREKIIIQSKCSICDGYYDCDKEYIIKSVENSIKRLNCDYLDILLLHRPDALMDEEEVAEAFEYLYEKGLVRHFGVSNMNSLQIELLQRSCKHKLISNQLQLSLAHSLLIDTGMYVNMKNGLIFDHGDVLNYCRINKMLVQAWSILQIDLEKGSFLNHPDYQELNHRLAILAKKYDVTPACIAIAFILRHPAKIMALAGTTNKKHLVEIVKASEIVLERKEWYDLYLFDKTLA